MDGDGRTDLIVGDIPLECWYQQSNGSFLHQAVDTGETYKFVTGDVNGDGAPDLLNENRLYLNNNGQYPHTATWDAGLSGPDGIWIRDFNNDGRSDLLIFDQWALTPGIYWYENLGNGTSFQQHRIYKSADAKNYGDGACAEDLDMDGKADVVGSWAKVGFFRQVTPDSFVLQTIDPNFYDSHWIRTGNLDYKPNGSDIDIDIYGSRDTEFVWFENRIRTRYAAHCTLVSSVLSVNLPADWRYLTWDAVRRNTTTLEFRVRTGSSLTDIMAKPWSAPIAARIGFQIDSFDISGQTTLGDSLVQYQVRMAGADSVPAVYAVGVRYEEYVVPGPDAQAVSITAPTGNVNWSTSLTPGAVVRNAGNVPISFNVRFDIGDGYSSTRTVSNLPAGESASVSFDQWTAGTPGNLTAKCTTLLAGDVNPANDGVTGLVFVQVHDVACRAIVQPVGVVYDDVILPRILAFNPGNVSGPTTAVFRISDAGYCDTVLLPAGLPLAGDTELAFRPWTTVVGTHACTCWVTTPDDWNTDNDWQNAMATVQIPAGADMGVNAILSPDVTILEGTVQPGACIRNYWTTGASAQVWFILRDSAGAQVYRDSLRSNPIAPGADDTLAFAAWTATSGAYVAECSLSASLDTNPANDQLSRPVFVQSVLPHGWIKKTSVPVGPANRRVKTGGALACTEVDGTPWIYALKGGGRYEFYRYGPTGNFWETADSIPAIGSSGRIRGVKSGAGVAAAANYLYVTKGNNCTEFWRYDPALAGSGTAWVQMPDVPTAASGKRLKNGTSVTTVVLGDTTFIYLLKANRTSEFFRYNTTTGAWEELAQLPLGASDKRPDIGSGLAFDGVNTVYATKGKQFEFYAYDVDRNTWSTAHELPRLTSLGRKVKLGDGGALVWAEGSAWLFRGNNSTDFLAYEPASDSWSRKEDMTIWGGKRIKGGGALAYCPWNRKIYGLRGNNTLEFGMYYLTSSTLTSFSASGIQVSAASGSIIHGFQIRPNPTRDCAYFTYRLTRPGRVTLSLYDANGRRVRTTVYTASSPGARNDCCDAHGLAAGVYIARLETSNGRAEEKLIIE